MWTLSRSTTWTSAGPLPFDKCYVVQWQQLQFCQTCSPWLTLGKSQKSKLCTDWLDTTCERLGSWPQIGLILPQIQSNWPLSWLAIFGWADGPVAEGRYFHHQWQILALCPGSSEVISFSSVFWFTLTQVMTVVNTNSPALRCAYILFLIRDSDHFGLRFKLILCKVQGKRFGQVDKKRNVLSSIDSHS